MRINLKARPDGALAVVTDGASTTGTFLAELAVWNSSELDELERQFQEQIAQARKWKRQRDDSLASV